MRLSSHHLTLTELAPAELAAVAAELKCEHICLFVKVPGAQPQSLPRVEGVAQARALKRHLDQAGITVWNVDTFVILPDMNVSAYRETLDIAAALGARTINAINLNAELTSAAAALRDFAELAAPMGLTVVLEWYRFSATNTLAAAVELVQRVDLPNVKLNVDILHLMRNGDEPSALGRVDPAMIGYAQICDGALSVPVDAQMEEAIHNRNFPGEGEFPLVNFTKGLPAHVVLSIEAPVNRLRQSLDPRERARRAVAGARRILAAAHR
jgi:sugar phosphate isomerase/epimerase